MRWLVGLILVLCTGTLLAQSLGDVARAQRNDENRPKAKRVITNADVASAPLEETSSIEPQRSSQGAQPARLIPAVPRSGVVQNTEPPAQQRRVGELGQQVQLLQSDLNSLEEQRASLRRAAVYGDPTRVHQNEEINRLGAAIEEKRNQLATARDEYADEVDRARKSSVLK
jgi:hypothetical protein